MNPQTPGAQPFYGRRISKQGVNVVNATQNQLIMQEDYDTGTTTYYGANGKPVVQLGLFPGNSTNGQQIFNSNGTLIAQFGEQTDGSVNLKFFDSNGIGLAQFGQFANGDIALKVAKAGTEVGTASNANLIFNSEFDMFKIVQTGVTTIPSGSTGSTNSSTSVVVAHNLGFAPAFLAYTVDPVSGAFTQMPYFAQVGTIQRNFSSPNNGLLLSTNQYIYGLADTANITFSNIFANANYPSTYSVSSQQVRYYLLQETAD